MGMPLKYVMMSSSNCNLCFSAFDPISILFSVQRNSKWQLLKPYSFIFFVLFLALSPTLKHKHLPRTLHIETHKSKRYTHSTTCIKTHTHIPNTYTHTQLTQSLSLSHTLCISFFLILFFLLSFYQITFDSFFWQQKSFGKDQEKTFGDTTILQTTLLQTTVVRVKSFQVWTLTIELGLGSVIW